MLADHHTAAIHNAAHAVAAAMREQDRAGALYATAVAAHEKVANRAYALDADRAAIVGRRQAGETHPDDAGMLLLNQADREGIAGILSDAEQAVAVARAPVDSARQGVAAATQMLDQTKRAAMTDALVAHAQHLDGLLLETVQRIHAAAPNVRPPWGASIGLRDALRRLSAARSEL